MCYFDKDPIYITEELEPPEECNGEGHDWYYFLLLIIHIYALIDFLIRLLVQKYPSKYLTSYESVIELTTIVPFLLIYVTETLTDGNLSRSYGLQLFIMLD